MIDINEWLQTAKADPKAQNCGMYLTHNGVVRATSKAQVREGAEPSQVSGMKFSYNSDLVKKYENETLNLPGIYYVRTWLNEGTLNVGDDIMFVLIGGDIRPHVVDALQFLVDKIKSECVNEEEMA